MSPPTRFDDSILCQVWQELAGDYQKVSGGKEREEAIEQHVERARKKLEKSKCLLCFKYSSGPTSFHKNLSK
jgi:hypothetical protein